MQPLSRVENTTKNSVQKLKYLEKEKSFEGEIKAFLLFLKGF